MKQPFFSIITVAYRDAWAASKTARSVFRQSFDDFEYIFVDGNSQDGTAALVEFWREQSLIDKAVIEPDRGVYDAMNKGIDIASGRYVCFMNSGDVFASDSVLRRAHEILTSSELDGCLGWGELNGQIWASWCPSSAFKLSSLGFCHQSLFVRRDMLDTNRFDDRSHKTDSDTLQLGRLFDKGANISIIPEIWAIRGGEPGISANLDRTGKSIIDTILTEYPGTDAETAEAIVAFRRRGEGSDKIEILLKTAPEPLCQHLACMVMDTVFQRPSRQILDEQLVQLVNLSLDVLESEEKPSGRKIIPKLIEAQQKRSKLMTDRAREAGLLHSKIADFAQQENARFDKAGPVMQEAAPSVDYVVSLTSFPARIKTLPFVIRSLFEQTQPPKEIHLFIGKDEIPNRNWLPGRLLDFEDRGLCIRFVERTHHQYDKFLHGAEINAEQAYVIVDDDVIYRPTAMETLLDGHTQYPKAVIGNRCHIMAINDTGQLAPYSTWQRECQRPKPSFDLMPTGAGGVLYPRGFMNEDYVTDIDLILYHAPYADDIWLKACALARDVPTFATKVSRGSEWYHRYTPTMQAGTLMATNVQRGLNDAQLARCARWLDERNPKWRQHLLAERERNMVRA